MGSISRTNQIDRFIETFGKKISDHFQFLVGLTIEELKDVTANYHVKGRVRLSNDEEYPVHYRWTSLEEDNEKKELDDQYFKMDEYYSKNFIGKPIISVALGSDADRDDEAYLLAYVNDENCLEIPLGFDPEYCEFSDFAANILDEDEIEKFKGIDEDEID